MSLKTEIDKTNEMKNKTKKAKENINTKLVKLGGQNATDLADVPNKIGAMVTENYRKVATGTTRTNQNSNNERFEFLLNLDFVPTRIMLVVTKFYYHREAVSQIHDQYPNGWLDSELKDRRVNMTVILNSGSELRGNLRLISFDSNKLILTTETLGSNPNNTMTINWIAIG